MKSILYLFIALVNRIMPKAFKMAPYTLSLFLVRIYFRKKHNNIIHIWSRNSTARKDIIFALSDLDLTVITKSSPSKHEVSVLRRKHASLKKVIPIISEINLYDASAIERYRYVANFFEINRDPLLLETFFSSLDQKKTSLQADAAVFLLRMIHSDYHNLSSIPQLRMLKWKNHLEQMPNNTLGNPNRSNFIPQIPCLVQYALNLVVDNKDDIRKYQSKIESILHYKEKNDPTYLNYPSDPNLMFFFPHIWVGIAIIKKRFEIEIGKLKSAPRWKLLFMLAQIDWELWGTFNQYYFIDDHIHLLSRLTCFKTVILILESQGITSPHRIQAVDNLILTIKNYHRQ